MPKRISAVALAMAMALVAIIAAVQGTAAKEPEIILPQIIMPQGCKTLTTAQAFDPFSAKVWDSRLWRREPGGQPDPATLDAKHLRVHCAASKSHARAMRRKWEKDRAAYYDVRGKEKARIRRAKQRSRYLDAVSPPGLPVLEAIAACESGGDPTAVSPDGTYRGKYQFDYGTWASVGGSGDPAAASEQEQDERAATLYRLRGSSPWPVCGR